MKKLALILFLFFARESFSQWESLNDGLYGGVVNALLSDDGTLLAATNGGFFRSTDGGRNWSITKVIHSSMNNFVKVNDIIFVTTDSSLYASTNAGMTWDPRSYPGKSNISLASVKGALFASDCGSGIFRSTDGGANWTITNNGLNSLNNALFGFGDVLLAGSWDGVYRSTDGGANWKYTTINFEKILFVNNFDYSKGKVFAAIGDGYLVSLDSGATWEHKRILGSVRGVDNIVSKDGNIYATNYDGIFLSTDCGETWTIRSAEFKEVIYSIVFNGNEIIAGTAPLGIFISTDCGISWKESNNGLNSITIKDMAINEEYMIVASSHVFFSSNGGAKWHQTNTDIDYFNSVEYFQNKFYAGTYWRGIYSSSDYGVSWIRNNSGVDSSMILTFAIQGDTLYAGGDALYRTTDGVNWTKLGFNYKSSSILPINDKIYVVTWIDGEIYASGDGGESWIKKMVGIPNHCYVHTLSNFGSSIIAGTEKGFYISNNDGDSWENRSDGLTNKKIYLLETIGNTIIAGGSGGLFVTKDLGLTWKDKTGNLPVSYCNKIKINGQYIYVGTSANGLYRAKLSDLGIISSLDPIRSKDLTVFPNPASEYLTVNLGEVFIGAENMIIADLLGNVVLEAPRDKSSVQKIDISRLLPGVYSLRCGEKRSVFIVNR